ncbi:hypothetical protein RLOC_00006158 [Lonchura striata]|uniref:Uncharacterized protein n=1 Tax=Lonchura striata TaxID=40157 RepID=A0A218V495_9PASE|nr:hypothetical protein RLOC_00006158 [Lonchura striata domestica]
MCDPNELSSNDTLIVCSTLKNTATTNLPLKECGKLYQGLVLVALCLDTGRYPKLTCSL